MTTTSIPAHGRRSPDAASENDTAADGGTRERILRVSLELFATQGFAATSTRELAERLGFTKPALYYHFRTKDDLLAALIQPVIDELAGLITRTPLRSAPSARRQVLADYIEIVTRHLDLIRVLTQDPSVTRRPVSAAHAGLQTRMMQLLAGHEGPDAAERTRARCALGAIRAGMLHADAADAFDEIQSVTFAAACAALGIRAGRLPSATTARRPESSVPT